MIFGIGIGLAVVIAMHLLRLAFPPRLHEYKLDPGKDLQPLRREYAKWELAIILAFLLLSVICAAFGYFVLSRISAFHASTLGDSEFILTPGWPAWLLASMFLGMCVAGFILEPVIARILGERQREYDAYQEMKLGRVARLKSKHAVFLYLIPTLILSALLFDNYFVFGPKEMVFNRFFGIGEEAFQYSEVERILAAPATIAPNGSTHHEWRFVIYFRNGKRWNCVSDPSGIGAAGHIRLAEFVSQKSGVAIEQFQVLKRADQ